jgi:hypothetical protein
MDCMAEFSILPFEIFETPTEPEADWPNLTVGFLPFMYRFFADRRRHFATSTLILRLNRHPFQRYLPSPLPQISLQCRLRKPIKRLQNICLIH